MGDPKPFKVELPDAERGRSPAELRLLDEINARLAKPPVRRNGKSPEDARLADLRERDRLEHAATAKAEAEALRRSLQEAAQLAEARGEEVEADGADRLNIRTRDSLQNLANAGKLTSEQVSAGRKLRACYESRGAGLGSALADIRTMGTSPTYDNRKAVWAGLARGEAALLIGQVEGAIRVGHFRTATGYLIDVDGWRELFRSRNVLPHVALQMLQEVVGHGKPITAFGQGPTVRERHTTALATALDMADAVIRGR